MIVEAGRGFITVNWLLFHSKNEKLQHRKLILWQFMNVFQYELISWCQRDVKELRFFVVTEQKYVDWCFVMHDALQLGFTKKFMTVNWNVSCCVLSQLLWSSSESRLVFCTSFFNHVLANCSSSQAVTFHMKRSLKLVHLAHDDNDSPKTTQILGCPSLSQYTVSEVYGLKWLQVYR